MDFSHEFTESCAANSHMFDLRNYGNELQYRAREAEPINPQESGMQGQDALRWNQGHVPSSPFQMAPFSSAQNSHDRLMSVLHSPQENQFDHFVATGHAVPPAHAITGNWRGAEYRSIPWPYHNAPSMNVNEIERSAMSPETFSRRLEPIAPIPNIPIAPQRADHQNERPFRCEWKGCSNKIGFHKVTCLRRHVETIHIAPGSFICSYHHCAKSFNRREHARNHERMKHEGEDIFDDDFCCN